MSKPIKPVVLDDADGTISRHPAFGMVNVSRLQSTGTTLYASDLNHKEVIELRFYGGETKEIDGQIHHMRDHKTPVFGVQMSTAQWASMITSIGLGSGVPCTMTIRQDGDLIELPGILPVESTRQKFDRQISEAAAREIQKIRECQSRLSLLVEKGKAGKRELDELNTSLKNAIANLPSNLAYSTTLLQEAMDQIVSNGKAELEASALGVAARLGVKEIGRLADTDTDNPLGIGGED